MRAITLQPLKTEQAIKGIEFLHPRNPCDPWLEISDPINPVMLESSVTIGGASSNHGEDFGIGW